MNTRGLWFVGTSLLALGGCILGYPLDQYEPTSETGGSGNSVTATSSGGLGGGSSSSGGGIGGAGGGGGGLACTEQVVCNERPISGCDMNCPVHTTSTRLSAANNQFVRSVAVNALGDVAIAGYYSNGSFPVNPADLKVVLPEAGGSAFNEGFIGYYNKNLTFVWAQNIGAPIAGGNIGRGVSGVAFDSTNDLVIAGVETLVAPQPPSDPPPSQFFIRKVGLSNPQMPNEPWAPVKPFSMLVSASSANAVATDGTDFYVLGETMDSGVNKFTCVETDAILTSGMFVAKFAANGTCQWVRTFEQFITKIGDGTLFPTAIYATNAATNGVWITGVTTRAISLGPSLASDLAATSGPDTYGFVVALSATDGNPTFGIKLKGDVTPRAISVLDATTTSASVVLAGSLKGATSLSEGTPPASSFVSVLQISSKAPADMMSPSSYTPHTTLLSSSIGQTDATAMVVRGNRIHVAGTISNIITVPPQGPDITVNHWASYFATLSTSINSSVILPLLGIQVFDSESAPNESPKTLYIASSMDELVLAGSWRNGLDISTRHKALAGVLNPIAGDLSYDVFFAKYSITP